MSDLRTKFALDNLSLCKEHAEHLTDWEMDFIFSICENERVHRLTNREFNKLHDIAADLRKRGFKAMRQEAKILHG